MLFGCIYIIYLIQTSSWTGLGKCREEDGKKRAQHQPGKLWSWALGMGQGWETLVSPLRLLETRWVSLGRQESATSLLWAALFLLEDRSDNSLAPL